jgi:hypothetical protein
MRALPCRLIVTALSSETHSRSPRIRSPVQHSKGITYIRIHAAWHTLSQEKRSLRKLKYTTQPAKALLLALRAGQADTSPHRTSHQQHPVGSHKQAKFTAYVPRCILLHCFDMSLAAPSASSAAARATRSRETRHTSSVQKRANMYHARAPMRAACGTVNACGSTCAWCAPVCIVKQLLLSPA